MCLGCSGFMFSALFFFCFRIRRPPISPLFPYTTLFRSGHGLRLSGIGVAIGLAAAFGLTRAMTSMLVIARVRPKARSEEHTSELQSLRHLVCRLLLEKKKKTNNLTARHNHTMQNN